MTKKRGLGRGLSALLEDPGTDITAHAPAEPGGQRVAGNVAMLPIGQIEANPFQPRTTFAPDALLELAQSIKELGIIQPITVRKLGYDRYQIISGERRFRASQVAGLAEIPAYIRIANDEAMLEMALVENIQREELDAIEVAISFQRLLEEVNLTQEALSEKVGKDRTTISNYLRLLKLSPEIQLALRQRQIGMGHARALLGVPDPAKQAELYRRIVESQLSVRQVEDLAREDKKPAARSAAVAAKMNTARHKELGKNLSERYGSRVTVKQAPTGKGRIEIGFRNDDDLQRIMRLLESR